MSHPPFSSSLASLYDSFVAEDAISSWSLLFGAGQGPNNSCVYDSWEELHRDEKFRRWKARRRYAEAVKEAVLEQGCVPARDWVRNLTLDGEETKRYREFDDETGLPTHDWKGDPLTHVEDLKAKKQFKEQQKTFEEREWKGESWDETQLGVFFLKKRNVLLELRSNVRKWDLERRKREEREEKNLKPETATEGAIILKNAFDKAKKYDSDRRNKADSRKTMLAMLAAENKLDELLVNLDNKMKEKKEELDEEEAIEKKDTTNTGEIINSTNKENVTISPNEENVSTSTNLLKKYGKIDPTIPSKPFNPHSTTWLKHTSLKYEVLRKRRDKSHLIVDGNREKGEGMRRTEKMKGVKSKLKTRWTVPPPLI